MDVKCVVCGEPWDYLGIDGGDMNKWEAKQFHAGAGCPSCEGQTPEDGPWEPEDINDVEYGDLDPMERLEALLAVQQGTKPDWGRPEPVVNWTCSGCGAQSLLDPDDEEVIWRRPSGSKAAAKWWGSHSERRLGDPAAPAHKFSEDCVVCEACHQTCDECGTDVSPTIEWGDVYDAGWCTQTSDLQYYCIECIPREDEDDDPDSEEEDDEDA